MIAVGLTRLCAGRVHYAWIVLAVMFSATLAGVGVRAAPGVMILPLQRAFGWDVSTISGAVSVNIILLGVTAPFLTGMIEVIGLKRMVLLCMGLLIAGTGLSSFMTTPWQMFLTWGFLVGIGSGAGAFGIAAAVANRWFVKRNGVAKGLLIAANAAGQHLFLTLLAMLAEQYGWQASLSPSPWRSPACFLSSRCSYRSRRHRSALRPLAPPWRYAYPRGRATRSPSP